jgi:ATP-binding cassette subfamily C (CFTR/MRP) protein 1
MKFSTGNFVPPLEIFIGVFAVVAVVTWNVEWAQIAQVLINIGPRSALRLHEVLVKTTFNAPMSFFESTDTSLLINHFSQDMSLIEQALPISMWQFLMGKCLKSVMGKLRLNHKP